MLSQIKAEGKAYNPREMSFGDFQEFMAEFLRSNPNASRAWDVITCQRGPDSPSERADMSSAESSKAYAGRRERKYRTVEIIRRASFKGIVGGAARSHSAKEITLPPEAKWDHFDKHCARAARVLGLGIVIDKDL